MRGFSLPLAALSPAPHHSQEQTLVYFSNKASLGTQAEGFDFPPLHIHTLSLLQGNLILHRGMHTCLVSSSRSCWQARPPSALSPCTAWCVGPVLGVLVFREKDWTGPMAQLRFVLGLVGGVRGEVIQPLLLLILDKE